MGVVFIWNILVKLNTLLTWVEPIGFAAVGGQISKLFVHVLQRSLLLVSQVVTADKPEIENWLGNVITI